MGRSVVDWGGARNSTKEALTHVEWSSEQIVPRGAAGLESIQEETERKNRVKSVGR